MIRKSLQVLQFVRKSNKEGHLETASKWPLVEAAGIEPASRDISMLASTCVVG